jgi:1,4-dihydroxy-2-naphthoate octaprenyltransferase
VGIYFVARGKSSTAFEFKFGNFTIKTRQVGLAILAIGALMILVAMTYSGNMVPLYKTF